jgi:hypothetical protein
MGFSIAFGKKRKMRKLIGNFVKGRLKEKTAFNQQMKRLDTQLHDKQIQKETHKQLVEILEMQYYQKQQEQWTKIKNKFQNPLKS